MKSSIIYENKSMTIGEIINYYAFNIGWFLFLICYFIFNEGFGLQINRHMDSNPCSKLDITNITFLSVCENNFAFLIKKNVFTKNIIFAFTFINFLHVLLKKYINKYLIYISTIFNHYFDETQNNNQNNNSTNSNNYKQEYEKIFELFIIETCFLLSLFNYPLYYLEKFKELRELGVKYPEEPIILYFICDFVAFIMMIVMILILIIKFYNSKIKNFKIEYVEAKFIDIEKNG